MFKKTSNDILQIEEKSPLQKLLKANPAFNKDFNWLCNRFNNRVVVWTPEVCFLAKKCFEALFQKYEIKVYVEIKPSGSFIIHFQ